MRNRIPILTYHSIDTSGSVISTSPAVFRRQMRSLKEAGFRTIALSELIDIIAANRQLPERTAVLTFDDGFHNFLTEAFPCLDENGFTATVFAVTECCGKYNDWSGNPPDLPRSELLGWPDIKELSASGIEFGSHTATHPNLTKIDGDEAVAELARSKETIEDALGKTVRTFAYPYGAFDQGTKDLASRYFDGGCTTHLGKVSAGDDLMTLARLDTYYLSKPAVFERLSTTSFDLYIGMRERLRQVKAIASQSSYGLQPAGSQRGY